jgi:hypothetical protein
MGFHGLLQGYIYPFTLYPTGPQGRVETGAHSGPIRAVDGEILKEQFLKGDRLHQGRQKALDSAHSSPLKKVTMNFFVASMNYCTAQRHITKYGSLS